MNRKLLVIVGVLLAVFALVLFGELPFDTVDPAVGQPADAAGFTGETQADTGAAGNAEENVSATILYGEAYYTVADVSYYLYTYAELPYNYMTKQEAEAVGWVSSEGNLWDVVPGAVIGGDRFGNYEGLLPEDASYTECDVNYEGGYRGAERLIFDGDGNIYYTNDHYASFTQLYAGDE